MIIDLTMPIDEKTPNFPGDPILKIKRHNVKQHTYGKTFLEMHTHVSTHVDAPSHMINGAKTNPSRAALLLHCVSLVAIN